MLINKFINSSHLKKKGCYTVVKFKKTVFD